MAWVKQRLSAPAQRLSERGKEAAVDRNGDAGEVGGAGEATKAMSSAAPSGRPGRPKGNGKALVELRTDVLQVASGAFGRLPQAGLDGGRLDDTWHDGGDPDAVCGPLRSTARQPTAR
jgi:hypothetical protein